MVYSASQSVNLIPLLAYQKIYYDFFSNSQWEKHKAYSYNVDYWTGTSAVSLVTDMIQLRYANYPKDYFMGMLPSSQYGSVAVLPPSYDLAGAASNRVVTDPLSSPLRVVDGSSAVSVSSTSGLRNVVLNSDLSALIIVTGKQIGRAHV